MARALDQPRDFLAGQGDARFSGAVIDPSGAFVPNATVVVKNERTGEERTVASNAQGRYVIPSLKPSVYTIRVTVGNFAPLEFTGLTLAAAPSRRRVAARRLPPR